MADLHPAAYTDLVAKATGDFYSNYLITASDKVVINGMNAGRGVAAVEFKVKGAQYSCVLDFRVCDFCRALNRTQVLVDSDDYIRLSPPQHGSCRCIWIFITDEEGDWEPDDDPYAPIHALAAELGKSVGEIINAKAHLNDELQDKYAPEVAKAKADIAQRRADRLAKKAQTDLDAQTKAQEQPPSSQPPEDEGEATLSRLLIGFYGRG